MKICKIEGCEKGGKIARGWCNTHYERWRIHGDPLHGGATIRLYTAEDPTKSLSARVVKRDGCLIWTGMVGPAGYGQIWDGSRVVPVHRFAWEQVHGPIPDSMFIDHICHVRSCVATSHLRLATQQQNAQNLSGAQSGRTLPRGVSTTYRGMYRARVGHNGIEHRAGVFLTVEEAAAAAAAKRLELFGEFAGK